MIAIETNPLLRYPIALHRFFKSEVCSISRSVSLSNPLSLNKRETSGSLDPFIPRCMRTIKLFISVLSLPSRPICRILKLIEVKSDDLRKGALESAKSLCSWLKELTLVFKLRAFANYGGGDQRQ